MHKKKDFHNVNGQCQPCVQALTSSAQLRHAIERKVQSSGKAEDVRNRTLLHTHSTHRHYIQKLLCTRLVVLAFQFDSIHRAAKRESSACLSAYSHFTINTVRLALFLPFFFPPRLLSNASRAKIIPVRRVLCTCKHT